MKYIITVRDIDTLNRIITCLETAKREKQDIYRTACDMNHVPTMRRMEGDLEEINAALEAVTSCSEVR